MTARNLSRLPISAAAARVTITQSCLMASVAQLATNGFWRNCPVTITIDDLEHAAAPGWRALEEDRLGDWLLRAADGFTGRANSALAAGDPGRPLTEAIDAVRSWYAARGLPAMIAVPYPTGRPDDSALDRLLAALGWTIRADAATVMTADPASVADRAGAADVPVEFESEPDQA